MRSPSLARVVLVVVLVGSCQAELDPAPPTPPLLAATDAARVRMHVRYGAARRVEEALAHSDLARAAAEAQTVAQLEDPEVLPRWTPYLRAVADAAREVAGAPDIVSAARLTGTLGRACARCHEATSSHILFPREPEPTLDKTRPKMLGHQWAAARMWEGLIGPADGSWRAGAEALTRIPLAIVAAGGSADDAWLADDVARVHLYATRALDTVDPQQRAEIFGALLGTCAHCHAAIRDR